jgi:hypothetical protein
MIQFVLTDTERTGSTKVRTLSYASGFLCRFLRRISAMHRPLDPDARARLATLQIVEPGLELVCYHVHLDFKERGDPCVGFSHGV